FEEVVPLCEQFNEQQRRAAATCGVLLWRSAALQQSISPISPPMLHDCSLECRGAPATALPATISKMTRDMSRVLIAIVHCRETVNPCQDSRVFIVLTFSACSTF